MSNTEEGFSEDFLEYVHTLGEDCSSNKVLIYETCVGEGCNESKFIVGSDGS